MTATAAEIFVVTSTGSGHLFPCTELCRRLISSGDFKTTLLLPSNLLSSLPSSFLHHPLLTIAQISPSDKPPMHESDPVQQQMGRDLEAHLSIRAADARPLCAIVDFQMAWTKHIFWKFNVPVISFFTFGASAAAMEWGAWKSEAGKIVSGEVRTIPGLPEDMCITFADLKRRPAGPQPADEPAQGRRGPPKPGDRPPWVPLIEGSIGLMFNTCRDIEGPFIDYIADQLNTPVWAVGPLLPEEYWKPSDSSVIDRQIRPPKHRSDYSLDEIIQWLDLKPRGSVLYVAFGSEVGPTAEEYPQLAGALEDSTRPFILVIQPGSGYLPHHGMDAKIGERGLIIKGWAPQLLILSHPSTGGFLSHCGWNSTVEAIGRGVPILAWPIRGDQIYNAKLVVKHLKVGYMALDGEHGSVLAMKEALVEGIEKLMSDTEARKRVAALRTKFDCGFPPTSESALDSFKNFIISQKENHFIKMV
ncbi:hypothetical protein RJ640_024504 [Escallonia rubra]|uniref:Glycosyltransferase n=1 Tax=Escallonia rubra TaxID=112253 RepID=A0AA88UFF6_9ASTE|nr:hypothetical protein RJ640_024504 [Escallonia rubra]